MKVVMIFDIDDEKVKRINSHDFHTDDAIDQINYLAEQNDPLAVWHFSRAKMEDISLGLNNVWEEHEHS